MSLSPEIITLQSLIQELITKNLIDMHTCIPAKVTEYNNTTQKVSVEILLKRKLKNGTEYTLPIITDVPVAFYRANNAFISLPIAKNDTGILFFSERSLDKWLSAPSSSQVVSPEDIRKFDLSDAIFYPGLYNFSDSVVSSADSILIQNNTGKVKVEDGKVAIGKTGTELLDLTSKLADEASKLADEVSKTETAIALITVATVVGVSSVPLNAASFTNIKITVDGIKSTIDGLKTEIDSIKGSF